MKQALILAMLLAVFAAAPPYAARAADEQPVAPVVAPDAAKPADKDAPKKEAPKKEEGGESHKAPADISGGRFAGDPVYVHLSPMILPVITDTGAEQIVTLQITIQVTDFDAADAIHTNLPRVMDSLMRALYGGLGNGDLRNGQLIDVSKVKARSIAALGEAIGASNIRDVLIEAVAQRRL